jgi:hypothetical protein
MTKFHKQFGQVEVTNSDSTTTTIVILATGEEKKLLTKYANLTDDKIESVKKVKDAKKDLTAEEVNHLAYLKASGKTLDAAIKQSTARYHSGKSGALSL